MIRPHGFRRKAVIIMSSVKTLSIFVILVDLLDLFPSIVFLQLLIGHILFICDGRLLRNDLIINGSFIGINLIFIYQNKRIIILVAERGVNVVPSLWHSE